VYILGKVSNQWNIEHNKERLHVLIVNEKNLIHRPIQKIGNGISYIFGCLDSSGILRCVFELVVAGVLEALRSFKTLITTYPTTQSYIS
jgi:hypothetical protein